MEKTNGLTAQGICDILKVCAKAKVTEFTLGDLSVKFHADGEAKPEPSQPDLEQAPQMINPPFNASLISAEDNTLVRDEVTLREEQLALMDMENPAEYERLVLSGDLNGEKTHDRRAKSAL